VWQDFRLKSVISGANVRLVKVAISVVAPTTTAAATARMLFEGIYNAGKSVVRPLTHNAYRADENQQKDHQQDGVF
jgi:hypothetical protein